MVRTNASHSKRVSKPPVYHPNGRRVHNKLLLSLPKGECEAIFAKVEFVCLPVRTVLNETGLPIKSAYFINGGLASILTTVNGGKSVEVGLCGQEGFVGLPLAAGFSSSPTRILMQVAGSAFRVSAKDFVEAL
jgi:hypothetical protein